MRPAVLEAERRPPPISRPRLYLLIALMVALWSANFIIGKVAAREFPVLTLSGLRVALAALILLAAFAARQGLSGFAVLRREWKLMTLLALFGVVFNQVFFIAGLKYTSVAHSSLIISLGPVFVLIIARLHGLEEFTALKVVGLALSLAGMVVLGGERSMVGGRQGPGPSLLGDLFAMAGSLAFAYYVVIAKEVTPRFDSLSMNTFTYALGALMLLPVTVGGLLTGGAAGVSGKAWLAMVYMAACASVAAYVIFYYALRFISATRMTALSYLQPVLATLLGLFLLKEPITARLLLGAAVVFTGVYLTEKG